MRRIFFFIMLILWVSFNLVGCNSPQGSSKTLTQEVDFSHNQATNIPSIKVDQPIAVDKTQSTSVKVTQKEDSQVSLDWTKPSDGEYPIIRKSDKPWIDVSIQKQRVYIKEGDQTLYTMITSSGLDTIADNSTPKGTFFIEPERGLWFYNNKEHEGAKYYVSWKNHGEFLFHSVPMTKEGKIIEDEAIKLGQKASHGCFRLTVADAKWIYDHIPVKTKVVIRD